MICVDSATFDVEKLMQTLYFATLHRLKTSDIDQEVKERAITCMGQIISSAGHQSVNIKLFVLCYQCLCCIQFVIAEDVINGISM